MDMWINYELAHTLVLLSNEYGQTLNQALPLDPTETSVPHIPDKPPN